VDGGLGQVQGVAQVQLLQVWATLNQLQHV
jgi:hypothetical protein